METLRKLGIEISLFTGNTDQRLTNTEKKIQKVKLALGALATASAYASYRFIQDGFQLAHSMNDAATKLGIGVEELQKWRNTIALAGGNAFEFEKGLAQLNNTLGAAQRGNKAAIKAFSALGYTPDQLKGVNNASSLLYDLSDRLKNAKSDAVRFNIASLLMSKVGKENALVFSKGAKALKKQHKEFEELGIIVGGDVTQAIDDAGDKLYLTGKQWDALKIKAATAILPLLENINKLISNLIKTEGSIENVKTAMIALGVAIAGVALYVAGPMIAVGALFAGLFLIINEIYHFIKGDMTTVFDLMLRDMLGLKDGKKVADDLRYAFKLLGSAISTVADALASVLKFIVKIDPYFKTISKLVEMSSMIPMNPGGGIRSLGMRAGQAAARSFTGPQPTTLQTALPNPGIPLRSAGNSAVQNNNINLTINAKGNGEDIRAEVERGLTNVLNGTKEDFRRFAVGGI